MSVTVLYFATLRDAAGVSSEQVARPASLRELYATVAERHDFKLPIGRLRVSMNGEFCDWEHPVLDGAEVAFLPPVSGG